MFNRPKTLALAAGFVSATGFAPLDLWPVALAALALFTHLVRSAPDRRAALARGYCFGIGHFTLGLNWIAHAFTFQDKMPWWLGYGAVVLVSVYLAVYPAVVAGIGWRWGRRDGLTLAVTLAAAWIMTEWLRATLFTGFAWNPLGIVLLKPGTAAIATLVGTYGLSGIAMLLGGCLYLLVERLRANRAGILRDRSAIAAATLLILLIAVPMLLHVLDHGPAATDPRRPMVRVVQPNIGQQEKYDPAFDRINLQRLTGLSGRSTSEPRLLLWPEAAVPDFLEEEPWARARIARLLSPRDMLLTGGVALIGDENDKVIAARNSLFAITPDARIAGRYDKAHLVPYGEYLPMRPLLSLIGISRLVPGDLDFWPGPGARSLNLPGFGKVGVQICYEIIFSGQVVDRHDRPDFLFNPSNDAWFGAWGPPQHLAQARLRAIEEGMPVVRSTPTGISAVVDADGRVLGSVAHNQAGFIETRLPAVHAPTPFARYGNLLPLACAIFLAGVAIARRRFAR